MMSSPSLDDDVVTKKPQKEIPVYQDQGTFTHATGDTYEGFFEIKKKDHSVKMNGPGIYTTASGEVYIGTWDRDKLGSFGQVAIAYPDGAKYEGIFRDWCYYGSGKYIYPDGTIMLSNFVDNCPVGNITVFDPNGHKWLGRADTGFAWLEPVNHYYDILEKTIDVRRKGKVYSPPPVQEKKTKKGKGKS